MTYLELCQKVNTLSGMQGTFSSVTSTGYQGTIAALVSAAWEDIQNLRQDWEFLKVETGFSTVVGQTEYTLLNIFGSSTSVVGKYRGILGDDARVLQKISYDAYLLKEVDEEDNSEPSRYAIHPTTQSIWMNPASEVEALALHYWRKPQVLANNTDEPICPSEFHMAIVYQALVNYGVFLGSGDMFQGYTSRASSIIGDMMRQQIPTRYVRTRPIC